MVKQAIVDKWQIEDNGPAKEFLKIKITCDHTNWIISLDQRAYIREIISKWVKLEEKTWTPMTMTPAKAPENLTINKDIKQQYPTLVGKLLWVSNTICPDMCYAINILAWHMSRPTTEAMQAALCVVKYLNQTQDKVLQLGNQANNGNVIEAYTNAIWASDPNTQRRSTSGSIVKVFGSVATWNLQTQKCVASSAVEAEYITGSAAARAALFHWHLLCGLGFRDHKPTILADNTGCIQVAKDPTMHLKLKHVDTKYHLLCNHVQEGDISMQYVNIDYNVVDFLTKPVSQHLLSQTRPRLGLTNIKPLICSVAEGDSEST